jgi:hypothetical protein
MRAHPNSNAAGYFPLNNSFAEALCENHRAAPFLAPVNFHRQHYTPQPAI